MPDRNLSQEIGRLLREEREKAAWTQLAFAKQVNTSQQWLSKVERGTAAPTTATVERLFAALGMKLRVTVVPLEADLDERIDALASASDEDRADVIRRHSVMLSRLAGVRYVFNGRLAAFLQGAPVPAKRLELAITAADLAALSAAIRTINCLRWDERWRDFSNYDVDPLRPGPMRWLSGWTELVIEVFPELPASLTIQVGGRLLPVRPLVELETTDAELATIMARVRQRRGIAAGPGAG